MKVYKHQGVPTFYSSMLSAAIASIILQILQ